MAIKPALTKLDIETSQSGFYDGFNKFVTIGGKLIIAALVIWAAVFSEQAGKILEGIKVWSFANFGAWYIYVMAFFVIVCFTLALIPSMGKIKLGQPDEKPEFSRFSWFSMMFGAGIGIGVLTFSTAEPLYHFSSNPETIMGLVEGNTAENVTNSLKWSFLHWGLSAWGCYALAGLALAFFSFNRGLPLTIRSALTPLFGKHLEGRLGHLVDITAVIATILGVAVTIGFGVSQFSAGMYEVSSASWLVNEDGSPSTAGMLIALGVIMFASTISALSGVGRGIKWLSNLNMGLSVGILLFFLVFGATGLALKSLALATWEYISNFPSLMFTYWAPAEEDPASTLYKWQSLWWSVFYWAWWIAFAPFVGLFLARISRGRTIREFVFGAMIVPSLMCFIWFALLGGTAIDLELNGGAAKAIIDAGQESQLYATLKLMVSDALYPLMTIAVVVLLLTYQITSADSAVLIINTINSGGDAGQKGSFHIIIWGAALTSVIAILLIAGGMDALKSSMFVGALPFSLIMVLMGISLIKAIVRDGMRAKQSDQSVSSQEATDTP